MSNKQLSPWWIGVVLVLYVINIRVEAGMATIVERTIDGLIGGGVLFVSLYFAARFFGILDIRDE